MGYVCIFLHTHIYIYIELYNQCIMFLCQARIYAFQYPQTCSNSDLKLYLDHFRSIW